MDLCLTGKKVLITGASQGIGAGLAHAFAEEGCDLKLTSRDLRKLSNVQEQISINNPSANVEIFPLDLTLPNASDILVNQVGDVDILINNAGVVPSGSIFDVNEKEFRSGLELKIFSYVNLCRHYYPRMKIQGGGVIINNIGNGGEICDPQYFSGAMANSSLMALTKALGGRSLEDNIRIIGVNPGPVKTDRIYKMLRYRASSNLGDENLYSDIEKQYPLGRPAHIYEIANLILFLASYHSGYTSGTIFTVDGGISSRRSLV